MIPAALAAVPGDAICNADVQIAAEQRHVRQVDLYVEDNGEGEEVIILTAADGDAR